jgi:hypothetical protein
MENELDILNSLQQVDISKVETSYPLLATGNVQMQITSMSFGMKKKKDESTYPNCEIKFALMQPWKTVPIDGIPAKDIPPGFPMTKNIFMGTVQKDGKEENYGLKELVTLRECIHGKAPEGARIQKEDFLGQTVLCKLKFDPAPVNKETKEVYGPRTDIVGYVRKKV